MLFYFKFVVILNIVLVFVDFVVTILVTHLLTYNLITITLCLSGDDWVINSYFQNNKYIHIKVEHIYYVLIEYVIVTARYSTNTIITR